jgi:hypothetical protein
VLVVLTTSRHPTVQVNELSCSVLPIWQES